MHLKFGFYGGSLEKDRNLVIGVIGGNLEIKEEHIEFTAISFEDFDDTKSTSESFDPIFIMHDYLRRADEEKYVDVYRTLSKTTFIVQTTKGYLPFVSEDLSYEDAPDIYDSYIAGYLQNSQDGHLYWGFDFIDDVENERNVNEMYTRVFKAIENLEK